MRKEELTDLIKVFTADNQENLITVKDAIDPSPAGMTVYDEPLVGFARADDELFVKEFKKGRSDPSGISFSLPMASRRKNSHQLFPSLHRRSEAVQPEQNG